MAKALEEHAAKLPPEQREGPIPSADALRKAFTRAFIQTTVVRADGRRKGPFANGALDPIIAEWPRGQRRGWTAWPEGVAFIKANSRGRASDISDQALRKHVERSDSLRAVWGADVQSPFTADEVAVLQQSVAGGSGWTRVAEEPLANSPKAAEPPKGDAVVSPLTVEGVVTLTEALVAGGYSHPSVAKALGCKAADAAQMYYKAREGDGKRRLNAKDHELIGKMMWKSNGDQTALERDLLNYFEDILVRPHDAVDWLRQKIAELEYAVL
jgi:hypothetical protein